jgi:hypothetical protein
VKQVLRWLRPHRRWRVVLRVDAADELPASIPRTGAVLVGPGGAPKWLAFSCPCGTGHQIMLNLDRRRAPYWTITGNRRLTISPSIDAQGPQRRCHYFVRQGTVTWVPNTNPEVKR